MNNTMKKPLSTFKKSVLSIVILSAVTGGLVALEKYRIEKNNTSYAEHLSRYSVAAESDSKRIESTQYFDHVEDISLLTTDKDELAMIAEQHLIGEPDEIADLSNEATLIDEPVEVVSEEKIENEGSHILIDNLSVLFALSSAELSPEYKLMLSDVALQINEAPSDTKWQVVGHTDKSGRASFNLSLAKQRAQNVALFLVEQGVDENKLTLLTLGEYEASNQDNSTYNKGLRKVEIKAYDPELMELAMKVKKDNQIIQSRLLKSQNVQQQSTNKSALNNAASEPIVLSKQRSVDNDTMSEAVPSFSESKASVKSKVVINKEESKKEVLNQNDSNSLNTSRMETEENQSINIRLSATNTNNYVL